MASSRSLPLSELAEAERHRRVVIWIALCVSGVGAGAVAGALATSSQEEAVVGLALIFLPILIWNRPEASMFVLVLISCLAEQYPIGDNLSLHSDFTDQTRLFLSLSTGFHLSGAYVYPIEIIFGIVVATLLARGLVKGFPSRTASALSRAALVFLVVVVAGCLHGLAAHGAFSWTLNEARPFLYILVMFLISGVLVGRGQAAQALLWALVAGTGIKALQGVFRFLSIKNVLPRPESVLAHEESFFFCVFIALTALLWLFGIRGRLRMVATALAPLVLLANLFNSRRTAWVILVLTLVSILAMAWVRRPDRRPSLALAAGATALLAGAYMTVFWNNQGSLGQPARAFHSIVQPTLRDKNSDAYRLIENANLALNIRRSPAIGSGFGIPIDYQIRIVDLSKIDTSIRYIPHDGVLYVLMRLGVVGATSFWYLLGASAIAAGRLLRAGRPQEAMFGSLCVCVIVAYVVQGYYDLGFSWLRIAIFTGAMLGALEAAAASVAARAPAPVRPRGRSAVQQGGPASAQWPGRARMGKGAFARVRTFAVDHANRTEP